MSLSRKWERFLIHTRLVMHRSRKRWALTVMYALLVAAGVVASLVPSQAVLAALATTMTYVWAGFLLLGSISCFIGRLRGRLAGEIVGIPLVSSSCCIFAVAIFLFGSSAAAVSVGFVFFGLGVGLLDRWFYLRTLLKTSEVPDGS